MNQLITDVNSWNVNSREVELYKQFLVALKTEDKEQLLKVCKETAFLDDYLSIGDTLHQEDSLDIKWLLPEFKLQNFDSKFFFTRFFQLFFPIAKSKSVEEEVIDIILDSTNIEKNISRIKEILQDEKIDEGKRKYLAELIINYTISDSSKGNKFKHNETIELLLQIKKIDPSISNNYLLYKSIENRNGDIVKLLLSHKKIIKKLKKNKNLVLYNNEDLFDDPKGIDIYKILLENELIKRLAKKGYGIREALRVAVGKKSDLYIRLILNKILDNKWSFEYQEEIFNVVFKKIDIVKSRYKKISEKHKKINEELEKIPEYQERERLIKTSKKEKLEKSMDTLEKIYDDWTNILLLLFDDKYMKMYNNKVLLEYSKRLNEPFITRNKSV